MSGLPRSARLGRSQPSQVDRGPGGAVLWLLRPSTVPRPDSEEPWVWPIPTRSTYLGGVSVIH
jgi:hypothetical protein